MRSSEVAIATHRMEETSMANRCSRVIPTFGNVVFICEMLTEARSERQTNFLGFETSETSHGRSSVGFGSVAPIRLPTVKKSETIRRKSTFRRVVKVSPSVVKVSWSVDFMSCSVDFVSCSVDFMSPLAPVLETRAFDITRDKSSRYGIRNSGSRSKKGHFELRHPVSPRET